MYLKANLSNVVMAIPPEFNNVEHVQNLVRRYVNKEIRSHFADLGECDSLVSESR